MFTTLYKSCLIYLAVLMFPIAAQSQCVTSNVFTDDNIQYVQINGDMDQQSFNLFNDADADDLNYIYALTGSDFNIISFLDSDGEMADVSNLDADKYFVWGFTYTGDVNLVPGDLVFKGSFSTGCWRISNTAIVIEKFSGPVDNVCGDLVDGGTVARPDGSTEVIFPNAGDGVPDVVMLDSTGTHPDASYTYVVTDGNGMILGIPGGDMVNVDRAGAGNCRVYGLSYTGNLTAMVGQDINDAMLSDECFDLSDNWVTTVRSQANIIAQLFVSSNTSGLVSFLNVIDGGSWTKGSFAAAATDADGIHYDEDNDVLYQLNRSDNVINAYSNVVNNIRSGMMPELTATSTADFTNGREIAVSGNRLVVAQDENDANDGNRFYVYDISPTAITLVNQYDTDINLWGIHATGETLYAVVDNSNQLAIFNDFFANMDGSVSADMVVEVNGIVRTHGLTYIAARDMMLMTDVGEGSVADDGAFTVIRSFMTAAVDGTISDDEQIRVEGDNTFLGNPVDIAYAEADDMIYIAERANGGGRLLGFALPAMGSTGGDIAPTYNAECSGASAITIGNDEDEVEEEVDPMIAKRVFVSSNVLGAVGVYNILDDNTMNMESFIVSAQDADGIYYDETRDRIYQNNRSDNVIDVYGGVNTALNDGISPLNIGTSTSDFSNAREITVSNNRLVVAQDASDSNSGNRFIVYDISGDDVVLTNSYDSEINLWGIQAVGETLFAIEDNSNRLAIYDNFFANTGTGASASNLITVTGIVRTHGLAYIADRDMMLLTDVGVGSVADDGAFVVVRNFTTASLDGTIDAAEQIRIEGDATFLGNPVDIDYCAMNDLVYIAERANAGGRLLAFELPEMGSVGGNIAPVMNSEFGGASAVTIGQVDGGNVQIPQLENQLSVSNTSNVNWTIYPNPVVDQLQVQWTQDKAVEKLNIHVINAQGQELSRQPVDAFEGLNTYRVNVASLPIGIYQILVETPSSITAKVFIKR